MNIAKPKSPITIAKESRLFPHKTIYIMTVAIEAGISHYQNLPMQ